jgi:hypothetical protein
MVTYGAAGKGLQPSKWAQPAKDANRAQLVAGFSKKSSTRPMKTAIPK